MPGDVHFCHCHGILPLCCAVIIWGRRGCVCPVINVFHNEIAALPMSMNGLRSTGECVFRFSFQVNKQSVASSLVDVNLFVGPYSYFILVRRVINDIPCCWLFAVFGACAGFFCQWVVWSSSLLGCPCPVAIPLCPRP
jgi:hypothetical protein